MNTKKYIFLVVALAVMGGFALIVPAFAENNQSVKTNTIVGTVSAISGNTVTVVGKQGSNDKTTDKTFTVDATNAKVIKNGVTIAVSGILVGDKVTVQGTITGTNVVATTIRDGKNEDENDPEKMTPNIVGKVSVISGNILTVISKQGFNKNDTAKTTTFTIDAANAKILRGETIIAISKIAVGDNVIVQGTVTGTNVVATMIRDGKVGEGKNKDNHPDNNEALLQIQGNGQPIVAGTISTISGSTVTITNDSNITYTINAANAKIVQGKNIIALSGLKVGDLIIVQGTVNGSAITASTIIDQTKPADTKVEKKTNRGFFVSIGQFLRRLFGF